MIASLITESIPIVTVIFGGGIMLATAFLAGYLVGSTEADGEWTHGYMAATRDMEADEEAELDAPAITRNTTGRP